MAERQGKQSEEQQRSRLETSSDYEHESCSLDYEPGELARTLSLISREALGASPNAPARASTLSAMQQTYGNRAVQRYLQGSAPVSQVSVQRDPEGGMWDFAKKLLGVDQVAPAVGKIVDKTKSGYNTIEKKLFDFLGVGGKSGDKAPTEPAPSAGSSNFEPYMNWHMEDALISNYQMGGL